MNCHMEEVGLLFQGWDLRTGTLIPSIFIPTTVVTHCRAGEVGVLKCSQLDMNTPKFELMQCYSSAWLPC